MKKMKAYISKDVASVALGAGAGLAIAPIVETYLPGSIINVFPPWTDNNVLIPISVGAVTLVAGILTDKAFSPFLVGFGTTSLISGILKGIFQPALRARAFRRPIAISPAQRAQRARLAASRGPVQASAQPIVRNETKTFISPAQILA